MSEPILTREAIARDAESAARHAAATGVTPANPHPIASDAAAAWKAAFERYLQAYSAPEAERSA